MAENTNPDAAEQTPAELKKQVTFLTKQLAQATADRDTYAQRLADVQATVETQKAEITAQGKELADAKAEVAESTTIIDELKERLENADAIQAESSVHVLTFEGKQYKVLAPTVQHKGVKYEAKTLQQHPEVLRDLIGDGKGLIQLIVKAKAEKAK
jgi:chromosome segregation ATPase